MEREQAVDRFLTFADAVVAIAITLLAIPLLDVAREQVTRANPSYRFADWWDASWSPLLGLLISFAVIGRLWWAHHRIWEHVAHTSRALVISTFTWLLTIVLIPVATAITTSTPVGDRSTSWAFALYVGVMIASGICLLVQSAVVWRHPQLADDREDGARDHVIGSAETVVGFVLALAIGLALPAISYWGFLVLFATGRVRDLVERRLDRRRARLHVR